LSLINHAVALRLRNLAGCCRIAPALFVIGSGDTNMAKLTITTFITLDGVMQGPGGPTEDTSGGFKNGGWLVPHFDAETGAFMVETFSRADAFLLGRGTFQIFASHWPKVSDPNDPIAGPLNKLTKHVASRSLETSDWAGTAFVRDVAREVPALKSRYQRELQVHGSHGLIQTLVNEGLFDELNVLTFPVVVGGGKRLFENGTTPTGLALASSRTTSNGIVIATYKRTGAPTFGTVPPAR
jgi:dihydrofolate reductase